MGAEQPEGRSTGVEVGVEADSWLFAQAPDSTVSSPSRATMRSCYLGSMWSSRRSTRSAPGSRASSSFAGGVLPSALKGDVPAKRDP